MRFFMERAMMSVQSMKLELEGKAINPLFIVLGWIIV